MMTEERLAEIESLASKATAGPWALWTGCSWRRFGSETTGQTVIEPTTYSSRDDHPDLRINNEHDGAFVVAAREDVPDLVAEVRRLKQEVALLREIFETVEPGRHINYPVGRNDDSPRCLVCLGYDEEHSENCPVARLAEFDARTESEVTA